MLTVVSWTWKFCWSITVLMYFAFLKHGCKPSICTMMSALLVSSHLFAVTDLLVVVAARNGLHATAIKCGASPLFQCTGVSVTQSRRSLITIIVTYRPPDSDADLFIDFMDLMLSQLPHKAARDVCLVGGL